MDIKKVTHIYDAGTPREIKALDQVDITINNGTVFGLVGEMGSGKSTLASLMAGLEKPTSGMITIHGEPPSPGRNVGILFQQPEDFFFEGTLFEDMALSLMDKDLSPDEVREHLHSTLDRLGLDRQILNRSPFSLNRGMLRLAALATVLSMSPKYLILDEPTAGLDPHSRNKVIEVIKSLTGKVTIIYISHRIQEIIAIADNIAFMEQGKVSFTGTGSSYLNWVAEHNKVEYMPVLNRILYGLQGLGLEVDPTVSDLEDAISQIRRSLE